MRVLTILIIFLLAVQWPVAASAEWLPTGNPLHGPGLGAGTILRALPDGAGGAYVAWRDGRHADTRSDIYLQRITATGHIADGWPEAGLPVCVFEGLQNLETMVLDGLGGVFVLWRDSRPSPSAPDIYAQRVLPNGSIAPDWPLNGAPLGQYSEYEINAAAVADGTGGLYAAFESIPGRIYAQRLGVDGLPAPGWPRDGVLLCESYLDRWPPRNGRLVPDGAGGVIVVWYDSRHYPTTGSTETMALRLHADGTIAQGWPECGKVIALDRDGWLRVIPDGLGGFYSVARRWPLDVSPERLVLDRFTLEGERWPGWPADGLLVCGAPGFRDLMDIADDGGGGILITWSDYRPLSSGVQQIYVQRIRPDGTLASGWTPDGVRVSDPTDPYNKFESSIAPDGLGGAYVAWESQWSFGRPSFVQHLTPSGAVAPGWPASGIRISSSIGQFDPTVVSDGVAGAIVAWEERHIERSGVFAQRFVPSGPVAVEMTAVLEHASPERIVVRWLGIDAGSLAASVERREAEGDWTDLGVALVAGADELRYEDRAVRAGGRYTYRLAWLEAGMPRHSREIQVEVPARLALALEGFLPNPSGPHARVSFMLPNAGPATIDVLDVGGRRVARRSIERLDAGRHIEPLEGSALAPGVYHLRLTTSSGTKLARGVVVR